MSMPEAMRAALADALGPAPPGLPQVPCIGCGVRWASQYAVAWINGGRQWATCIKCFARGADDPGYDRGDLY